MFEVFLPSLVLQNFQFINANAPFLRRFLFICFYLYDLYRFDLDKICLHQTALYIPSKFYSVKNQATSPEEINVSIIKSDA